MQRTEKGGLIQISDHGNMAQSKSAKTSFRQKFYFYCDKEKETASFEKGE